MATKLLLADDSPTIAKILQMALASESYEIRAVLTAEEALSALRKDPPFLFLCDLTLPGKDGYEFAKLIRHDSKLRDVRVVLLASAFEPVDEPRYHDCGADALIKKPFDPAELRAKLRAIIDAPPKFPEGARVTGSLSGFMVRADVDDALRQEVEASLPPPMTENDADSILANLLGETPAGAPAISVSPSLEEPPPFAAKLPTPSPDLAEPRERTVAIDLSGASDFSLPSDVLDISQSFDTPPGGTAAIEFTQTKVKEEPADAPLSANAQALAAFFEAEITSHGDVPPQAPPAAVAPASAPSASAPPASAPSKPAPTPADTFDASLDSIDWGSTGAGANLDGWSSAPTPAAASAASASAAPAAPAAPRKDTTTTGFAPLPRGGGSASPGMMFDTGGSSFRFSDDYVARITKSFTGAPDETTPEKAPESPFFPKVSDDRPTAAPSGLGGGAWSEGDVARIERIVREEVQMVVREVAEKIAWEVIPELAENLIKKELEKVLKEMQ